MLRQLYHAQGKLTKLFSNETTRLSFNIHHEIPWFDFLSN